MADRTMLFVSVLQSFLLLVPLVSNVLNRSWRQDMAQRQEDMSLKMDQLLLAQEHLIAELRIQKCSRCAWESLLVAALMEWQFWATAGALIFLCCWLWKRSHQPPSSRKDTSRNEVEKEEKEPAARPALPVCSISAKYIHLSGTSRNEAEKEEKEPAARPALPVCSISAKNIHLSKLFTLVEHMVDELLYLCCDLSNNSFMPRLMPVIGVNSTLQGSNSCEEDAVYRLLVPLKAPPGHTFHLETGTTSKDMPARGPCLRVELQCTCTGEQLARDMLCFLHHPQKELMEKQGPSLLHTLCTGPYLDMEKTSGWLRILLRRAWAVSRHSRRWGLTVPHSRHSCNLWLMDSSHHAVSIHLMLGVQQGDSFTILSSTE